MTAESTRPTIAPEAHDPPWRGGDLGATLRREILLLTRNRTNLLLAIVPTAVYLGLFSTSMAGLVAQVQYRGQQTDYADFMVPALIFSSLLAASTTSGTALFQERLGGMSLELWSYPLRRRSYIAGKLLAGSGLVLSQAVVALVAAALLLGGRWPLDRWLALVCGTVLAALAFNGLYLLLASMLRDFQRFTVVINVLAPVLLFASPSFYTLEMMGPAQRWLAMVNPVTYGVTALRDALLFGFGAAWPYFVMLAALTAASVTVVGRALGRQAGAE